MLACIALSIIRFHLFESNRNVSRRASSGSNRRYRSPILGDKAVPAWLPRWKNDLSIAFFDNVYIRAWNYKGKLGIDPASTARRFAHCSRMRAPAPIGQLLYPFKRFPREIAKLYLIFLRKIRANDPTIRRRPSIPAARALFSSSTDCRRSIDKRNLVETLLNVREPSREYFFPERYIKRLFAPRTLSSRRFQPFITGPVI